MPRDHRPAVVSPGLSLKEAYKAIDKAGMMIALVMDADGKLAGTVTDGDLRRGVLSGLALDAPVERVMHRFPVTVPVGTPTGDVLALMKRRGISQVPLVDGEGRVVGLEFLNDLLSPAARTTPVVIFAGGFGTRLLPLTRETPKPMLPLGNRPVLELILERVSAQGFQDVFLAVHYKEDLIRKHFGDGSRAGVRLRYIHEPSPLGTAGALRLAAEYLQETFLVLNGDLLTDVNLGHMLGHHGQKGNDLTIAVTEYSYQVPYGVVRLEGDRVTDIQEKPVENRFVSAGIYVMEPSLLPLLPPAGPFHMPELLRAALAQGRAVGGFPIQGYWLDIGRMDDYRKAIDDVQEGRS